MYLCPCTIVMFLKSNKYLFLGNLSYQHFQRQLASSVPVIQIPLAYKKKMISKQRPQKGRSSRTGLQLAKPGKVFISCDKRSDAMLSNEFATKFNPPTITSSSWTSSRSPGRHFTIHSIKDNPSIRDDATLPIEELDLSPEIKNALRLSDITAATAIQRKAIPEILKGENVMFAAETGSGKTLAYLLPILHKLLPKVTDGRVHDVTSPLALVVTPTQELSKQVKKMGTSLNLPVTFRNLRSTKALKHLQSPEGRMPDILVTTPVPLLLALKTGKLELGRIEFAVLDECDTLLDDSFSTHVQSILQRFNIYKGKQSPLLYSKPAQLILSSATYPKYAQYALESIIEDANITSVRTGYLHRISPHVKHCFRRVRPSDKIGELLRLVENQQDQQTIVFCNNKKTAKWVYEVCQENAIAAILVDSSINTQRRSRNVREFLDGKHNLLVATDLFSRGLDTQHVAHVINYEIPSNVSDYLHRCGRVGRVGQNHSGVITSLVSKKWEIPVVMQIEEAARRREELGSVSANIKRKHEKRWINKKSNELGFDS